jgi:mRNA interferase ChpB
LKIKRAQSRHHLIQHQRSRAAGIIRCDQPRTLDMKARNGRRIEEVPDFIVDDVLARVTALFE